jgi:predicted DNA-binding transcriptional regulator AlpA
MSLKLIPPRLINREAAAAYVCLSPNTFDEMVKDGRMPRPRRLAGRRKAWDVRALDQAIDNLPIDGNELDNDTWSNVDGP